MSALGHLQTSPAQDSMSASLLKANIRASGQHVRDGPIVLKKSFWRDERKFLEPLMRFARSDMRDHIVSHKNDHGASYRRYGALQWRRRLKISFCEIFGVVRFSTFATLSANRRHPI